MKLQKTTNGNVSKVTFIPETEEEKRIMGTLRNHYFWGMSEHGTYPKYDGITTEDNYVTSMSFKFNKFE
jgi:hypothetical protein